MGAVAVGIICKTPTPGRSKTRLSPPLHPDECAAISACFIADLARSIGQLANGDSGITGYAVYTPVGSENALRRLLPDDFALAPQCDGDLGARLLAGLTDMLAAGHDGAILVNSDSPTLPIPILREAVAAVRRGNNVVLSPAHDGGYTLIGLSRPHPRLFEDIPWSTSTVYRLTIARAQEIGIPVANVAGWYDIDDAESLRMLEGELDGRRPAFAAHPGAEAPATRRFIRERRSAFANSAA